jgi:hypothetical protein
MKKLQYKKDLHFMPNIIYIPDKHHYIPAFFLFILRRFSWIGPEAFLNLHKHLKQAASDLAD